MALHVEVRGRRGPSRCITIISFTLLQALLLFIHIFSCLLSAKTKLTYLDHFVRELNYVHKIDFKTYDITKVSASMPHPADSVQQTVDTLVRRFSPRARTARVHANTDYNTLCHLANEIL